MSYGDKLLEIMKQKLASALSAIDEKPDALLFCEEDCFGGLEYDLPDKILGLPVFRNSRAKNPTCRGVLPHSRVPWLPVWKNGQVYRADDFNDAYLES